MINAEFPRRDKARRRDRHGRGIRGPVLPPSVPAWRTRADRFDDLLAWELGAYREFLGDRLDRFDFAVLDIPQQDPAPWEAGIPLARFLPFEKPARIHGRIIFYRMPIVHGMANFADPRLYIHQVVTDQIAAALDEPPEAIDYIQWGRR